MTAAALHPIAITMPLPAGVHPGAVVGYRGRKTAEHYTTFYVEAVDEQTNLLTLTDRDYPSVTTLHNVHPSVVRPTGHTVDLCDGCGHEAGWSGRGTSYGYCEAHPCPCRNHHDMRTDET